MYLCYPLPTACRSARAVLCFAVSATCFAQRCAQLCLDAGAHKLALTGFMLTLHVRSTGVHACIVQQELRTSHHPEQLVLALD